MADKSISLSLQSPNNDCAIDFRTEIPIGHPERIYFIPTLTTANSRKPVKICWTFGDGSQQLCQEYAATYTGTYAVNHNYDRSGNYEVCARVVYDNGCEAKKCKVVSVGTSTPTVTCSAGFRIEPVAATPLSRHFIATPENSAQKKPLQICWRFGDGSQEVCKTYATTYTGTYDINHAYEKYGHYEVCVTIKYDGGCESKKCSDINIESPANVCETNFFEVATDMSNLERQFYVGLMNGKTAERICWNFGDGGTETCVAVSNPPTQQSLTAKHTYAAPGAYKVCIKVYYVGGCMAERCKEVVIRPQQPITTCGGYLTEQRTDEKTYLFKGFGITTPSDHVISYSWTFGDGTTGTGNEIKHTYAGTSSYTVCLIMRTESGCETKICKQVGASIISTNQPRLVLSPNPVSTTLHAVFYSTKAETMTIKIFNANGVLLKTFTRPAVVGANDWDFADVATLPNGIYSVLVQSPTQLANAIFFKQ